MCSSSLLYMVSPGLLEGWGPESSESSLSHIAIDASCKAEPFGLLAGKPTNGCISHGFYLLYSDVLTSWGLADSRATAHPRATSFLEKANNWLINMSFICKPINPEPIPPATSFLELLHSRPLLP